MVWIWTGWENEWNGEWMDVWMAVQKLRCIGMDVDVEICRLLLRMFEKRGF